MAILSNDKRDVSVSNDFKTSEFKIQASAKAFEILSSNIYTNKVRAVIREYNCNAYDAHVAAGTEQTWDVHLPSVLEPFFSVRDYGTGLSDEQVREIFTTYFHSTKTNSNDFVGALGLGSKSAFSLVDSFTVVSYYNGTKSDYCCYKDAHGEPQISLLASCDTEEPNGLQISMSVEGRQDEFEDEAVHVFKYFDELPNINDKEVVAKILEAKSEYKFVCREGSFNTGYGHLYARMGNVAYRIPQEYQKGLSGFINFEIGDLSFNAGREELSLDDSTKEKLESHIKQVKETLARVIYNQLMSEQCKFKRAKAKHDVYSGSMCRIMKNSDLNFDQFDLPLAKEDNTIVCYRRGGWHRDSVDIMNRREMPFGEEDKTRYFHHKDRMKMRIMNWMKTQRGLTVVLLKQEHIDLFNVPTDLIEDLEDVVPKSSNSHKGSTSTRSKVAVWNGNTPTWKAKPNDCWNDTEIENDGTERVYVEINRYEPQGRYDDIKQFKNVMDSLEHLNIGIDSIYGLKTAFLRTKAFKQGNWISLTEYIQRETADLPEIEVVEYSASRSNPYEGLFQKLFDAGLDNEEVRLYNESVQLAKGEHSDKFAYRILWLTDKIKSENKLKQIADRFVAKYPVVELLQWEGCHASDNQIEILINHIQGENK